MPSSLQAAWAFSWELSFAIAGINPSHGEQHRTVALFGFLRGLVLGLAGISVAGPLFSAVFGLLSGAGLTISYLLGFAPTQDYEAESKPHISGHKVLASLWRAVAVGIAGIVAGGPQRAKNLLGLIRAETRFGSRDCERPSRSFQPSS